MHLVTNARRLPAAVPLKSAVLCVDCESVSSTRFDKCPVCGSTSLFSIAPMLGGSIADKLAEDAENGASMAFDVSIKIEFRHIVGEDVNAALSDITELVGVKLGRTQASLHIDVEPVTSDSCAATPNAA